jgi:NTE family protein
MQEKNVLVLAGGSVKAAFQVGAIKALFEKGFKPNKVYGISAGSMNASFLSNFLGKQKNTGSKTNFVDAADALIDFWLNNINAPSALARRRGTYELGMSALRRNFDGLLDTTPLREMLYANIQTENLLNSPLELEVGAVDIQTGKMFYAKPNLHNFHDYVLASSAIPILMPVVKIGDNSAMAFLDGGLRDVAPIKKAILDGAQKLVCIACHTEAMEAGEFAYGNLLALVDRIMDITVNESLNNDLEWATMHQKVINSSDPSFNLTVLRPHNFLHIDIQDFDKNDIERVIRQGYDQGLEQFTSI